MINKKRILTESFEWINLEDVSQLPKDRLLRVVAKTPTPTRHPEDTEFPLRYFVESEVMKASRTAIGKPVGMNHERMPIYGAYCVDGEWNEEEKQAEALLFVPTHIVNKVKEGKIDRCSIEYSWRRDRKKGKGRVFEGLNITRIDVLEGLDPGDSGSIVKLFESKEKKGRMEMKIEVKEESPKSNEEGCVWSTQWDSPEACIAANQDKDDPEAYCMAKIESKTEQVEEPVPVIEEPLIVEEEVEEAVEEITEVVKEVVPEVTPEQVEEIEEKIEPVVEEAVVPEPTIDELKESLERVMKVNKELKESVNNKIEEAVKSTKSDLKEKIESVIPHNMIVRRFGLGSQRFVSEIKKILRETVEE